MTIQAKTMACLVALLMLAASAGCARHTTEASGKIAPEPYAYDSQGQPYYRDEGGRSYSLNARGERQYGAPAQAGDGGQYGKGYRVDQGGIAYYVDKDGRRYLRGEKGRKLYVDNRVDTLYVDESGRRYYIDASGVHHYIQHRYDPGTPGYVEGAAVLRESSLSRGWFADEAGRRYYLTERGRGYMVDEAGVGYYVIQPEPGVSTVQIIRWPVTTATPQEAAMLRCDQVWNECFLRCNERGPNTKAKCMKNCDKDLDSCMGRRQ